jgi:hypothetical protein
MRIAVQWARSDVASWEDVQAQAWRGTQSKADPTGTTATIDSGRGWVNRICIQGVEFNADHYAVEVSVEGAETITVVTIWWDDASYVVDRSAQVWTFREYKADAKYGGIYNTRQSLVVYGEGDLLKDYKARAASGWRTTGGPVEVLRWNQFTEPDAADVRHGVMMDEALYQAHEDIRERIDWREWAEGVPAEGLNRRGKVRTDPNEARASDPAEEMLIENPE